MVNKENMIDLEYPLKVVEMEEFFLNFDSLVWRKLTKKYSSVLKMKSAKSNNNKTNPLNKNYNYNCYTGNTSSSASSDLSICLDELAHEDYQSDAQKDGEDDSENLIYNYKNHQRHPSKKLCPPCMPSCLDSSGTNLTLLFIDSNLYRKNFEKSHLKLVNNIIVLNRY
jgi:hypothetical protein